MSDQRAYWDKVANEKTFTHPIDLALLEEFIKKDSVIVDLGCGYGRLVKTLSENGFTHVRGFDTSTELIKRGRAGGTMNIHPFDSIDTLALETNSVDCILLFAVLTCIPSNADQEHLIRVLRSKLKPGGIIYISDYYLQENSREAQRYDHLNGDKNNFGVFTLPEGATFRHHSKEWITSLLHNFWIKYETIIDVKTMNGHTAKAFQIVAIKK